MCVLLVVSLPPYPSPVLWHGIGLIFFKVQCSHKLLDSSSCPLCSCTAESMRSMRNVSPTHIPQTPPHVPGTPGTPFVSACSLCGCTAESLPFSVVGATL